MIAAAIIAVFVLALVLALGLCKIAARADVRAAEEYERHRARIESKGWAADGSDEP